MRRVECDGAAHHVGAFFKPPALIEQYAHEVQRVELPGIDLQDFAISLLGRIELAGLVMLEGRSQRCWNRRCIHPKPLWRNLSETKSRIERQRRRVCGMP